MTTILVVDDNPFITELINETLGIENYSILVANSGDEAIEKAQANKPDLIIMDVMMPGEKDGFEATRTIKSDPALKECKIILLTAKGQQSDRIKGIESGAEDYIVKPFSPMCLLEKVEQLLNNANTH